MRKRGRPGREPDPLDALGVAPLKLDIEPLKIELPELPALDITPLALDELPELPAIELEPVNLDLPELDLKLDLPELDELPAPLADGLGTAPRKARKGHGRHTPAR